MRQVRREQKKDWDDVPDEAFMVIILNKVAMQGVSGVAKYGYEFEEAL